MRNILIYYFFSLLIVPVAAQQDTQPGEWITVNIDMTDSMTTQYLGFDGKSKLESKVLSIVSRNGLSSKISCVRNSNFDPSKMALGELNTGILCKPKFEVVEEELVNPGMEKMIVVKVSLSLYIQSVRGNVIFSSITQDYAGTGKDKKSAINNAVSGITVVDERYKKFLTEARDEIVRYYNAMCQTIIQQAVTLAKFKRHSDAIFLLWPIPFEVKCHDEARDTMVAIFRSLVEYNCSNYLYNAKTYITSKDYGRAMEELRKIDAEASCSKDAIALMDEIAVKVDAQEQQYIDLYKKMRENEFELEKERYRSISNINKTYTYNKVDIEEKH